MLKMCEMRHRSRRLMHYSGLGRLKSRTPASRRRNRNRRQIDSAGRGSESSPFPTPTHYNYRQSNK